MKRDKDKTKAELTQELEEMRQRVNELEVSEAKRKQAEEALQASEEKFSKVFRTSPDSMVITSVRDGKFIEVNDSLTRVMGFTREETIGRTSIEMDIWESPEDRNRIVQMLQQQGEVHELEIKFRNKWGESRDGLFSANLIDIADEPCMIALTTDITERKKAEDILRMSERDLAEAQELAHVGNWRWEIIPDEVYWSDEAYRLFGVEPGEAVDYAKYLSIVLPEDRDFIMKEVQDALDGIKPYENEHRKVRNGEIRIHHTKGTVTQDEQGKPIRFLGVVQDITEREQAEEREQELQRELYLSSRLAAVGELAAGVAHQINNPLTGVLGFSQRLLRKSTDQETNQGLKRIYAEAERAARVVQNLLTFARRRQPKKQYSYINDILESALELRAYELNTSNIEVVIDPAPGLPEIMLDFYQIEEVFLNLILNAEQAMTEANSGGKLTIKTEERKEYVRTTFSDNGPGIPAENLEKIFDPFFTTKGEKGGTGLGLSVCHGIISEHGGRIYAKNKPGKGATFFIELPLPEH